MTQWEYKEVAMSPTEVTRRANEEARDGWRLCVVIKHSNAHLTIFERPIEGAGRSVSNLPEPPAYEAVAEAERTVRGSGTEDDSESVST